ncbi:MAG: SprT family zinc-dependent metalloprotease [Vibrio sp.]
MSSHQAFHPLISPSLQQQVQQKLSELTKTANHYFKTAQPCPEISYKLRGKVAGKAYLNLWQIRLNPQLLVENTQAYLDDVIAHELAHLFVFHCFGRVKPHGKEWQAVMTQVFKRPASTTHEFDVRSVQGALFEYQCQCQTHQLTIRRHQKVQRQQMRYLCRQCQQELTFIRPS